MVRNIVSFNCEWSLAPRLNPKLKYHPLSAVRDSLFNIFACTLHIGGRSSIRNLRTRHGVITGTLPITVINLVKPTGYVMHQQFNIQQLYALPTLYLCGLYLSENKQRLVPLTA